MNYKLLLIFILFTICTFPQNKTDLLKTEAVQQIRNNRLGEAIDLLNRYISANPQIADGYIMRGECYEKRGQFELAVYDYRSARKLEPNSKVVNNNLTRATNAWYKLLFNKIEGHKREIAINPSKAINYLEIGKCYKNMGQWIEAEEWYDKYLAKEEASSDEIIRYTEILAKNNHISKGEPILKRYCEKFPNDHRLWSRYGYFSMWLGKIKQAIAAFEKALELRPYFKEAMDGLDMAKGKGYIYTYNDTSYSRHKNYGMREQQKRFEYAIDKYYKILKKNKKDDETRFKLVEELIKVNRFEEAKQQLALLSSNHADEERYQKLNTTVEQVGDSVAALKIVEIGKLYEKNPNNKEAVLKLSEYYAAIENYDSSLVILKTYLDNNGTKGNSEVQYRYAEYLTWNYEFEQGINEIDALLKDDPNNLEYQLLRGQLAVWTNTDLELGEQYLTNVHAKEPDNIKAILPLATLKIRQGKYDEGKQLIEKARLINPNSKEILTVEDYYNAVMSYQEGQKIYQILFDARDLVAAGDCQGALTKYEDYFSKISSPTRQELFEYADVNACAKNYQKSFDIVNKLIEEEYDYDMAIFRGKAYLWLGDSVTALKEFQKLVAERPDNFDARFNLAAAYEYNQEYGEAEDIYNQLIEESTDSTQIAMLNQRKSWIPHSGMSSFFKEPAFISISPVGAMYRDNQNFSFRNLGGRFDIGITGSLSVGASVIRTQLTMNDIKKNLTIMKGHLTIGFSERLIANLGFGQMNEIYGRKRSVSDASLKYENKNVFTLLGYFEINDARLLLYSPNLMDKYFEARLFRLQSSYKSKSGFRFSGYTSTISVGDRNDSYDLNLRLGKQINKAVAIGYEYYYIDFAFTSKFYYSPQNFESHSVWVDWLAEKDDDLTINLGGKLGYIPSLDFMLREVYGELNYKVFENFTVAGKITAGSSSRYDSSYDYLSAYVSAYWSFWQ